MISPFKALNALLFDQGQSKGATGTRYNKTQWEIIQVKKKV